MSKLYGMDQAIITLTNRAFTNELDYQLVMDCLKEYRSPRAKLSRLMRDQVLIHMRKGLYVLGEKSKHAPYCLERIANLLYGPSYVSLERALHIYGLIPEHAEVVTSVTCKLSKNYSTSIGYFVYAHCPSKSYAIGVTLKEFAEHDQALIATPEKALIDLLTIRRGKITSMSQIEKILIEDLRIEEDDLRNLDRTHIQRILAVYPHSAIHFLEKWLLRLKGDSR